VTRGGALWIARGASAQVAGAAVLGPAAVTGGALGVESDAVGVLAVHDAHAGAAGATSRVESPRAMQGAGAWTASARGKVVRPELFQGGGGGMGLGSSLRLSSAAVAAGGTDPLSGRELAELYPFVVFEGDSGHGPTVGAPPSAVAWLAEPLDEAQPGVTLSTSWGTSSNSTWQPGSFVLRDAFGQWVRWTEESVAVTISAVEAGPGGKPVSLEGDSRFTLDRSAVGRLAVSLQQPIGSTASMTVAVSTSAGGLSLPSFPVTVGPCADGSAPQNPEGGVWRCAQCSPGRFSVSGDTECQPCAPGQ